MSLGRLPVERAEPRATFDLMAGGKAAFARILQRIDEAERSILVRCFEWRDDETGEMVARGLLRADGEAECERAREEEWTHGLLPAQGVLV